VPLYEYVCQKCQKQFEELVFGEQKIVCPACQSPKVERILSTVSVGRATSGAESAPSPCDSCCGRGGPGCSMS
jgi:putative FmdB family regulatory protein